MCEARISRPIVRRGTSVSNGAQKNRRYGAAKSEKRGEEEELMQMKAGKGKFIIAIISQRQGGKPG